MLHRPPGSGIPPTDKVARMRAALAGSPLALAEDRQRAAAVEEAFPGTARLFRAAGDFARRFAAWSVAERGCGGVVFAAAGLEDPSGPWHARAASLSPAARFVYADADDVITSLRGLALGGDEQATAARQSVFDPGGLLGSPEASWAARGGPLGVCLHLVAHYLDSATCASLLADCARLLPPGSAVAMTGLLLGPGLDGNLLGMLLETAGWPVHRHSEEDVAGWVEAAGMTLREGVTDVRERPGAKWRPARRERPEGRMIGVVGLVGQAG